MAEPTKWEYKILDRLRTEAFQAELHRLGKEGWEACNAVSTFGFAALWSALMKRPITEAT